MGVGASMKCGRNKCPYIIIEERPMVDICPLIVSSGSMAWSQDTDNTLLRIELRVL
jgi:hypothetical protein